MNVIRGIQFYIDSCTISEEQESVNIVLNNCYARALGAKLVSDTHLTATSSVLTYRNGCKYCIKYDIIFDNKLNIGQ